MDYEKKYKEALKRARALNNGETTGALGETVCEVIFPELKESEDEKIRKALIRFHKSTIVIDGIKGEDIIAWLENQAEQKSIWHNEDEEPQRGSLILLVMQSGTPIVAKIIEPNHTFNHGERWAYIDDLLEKQAEVVSDKDDIEAEEKGIRKAFNKIRDKKQGEQKPADKEYTFKAIPRLLGMIPPTDRAKSYCQKLIDSLEQEGYSTDAKIVRDCLKQMNGEKVAMATMDEQKPQGKSALEAINEEKVDNANKVEQKPAWSDEDDAMLDRVIKRLHKYSAEDEEYLDKYYWLIELKHRVQPQNTWKPSDEQIKAVKEAACYSSVFSEKTIDNLISLSKQLKKLREEQL